MRRTIPVLVLLPLLLVTGCSLIGGDDRVPVPKGFTRYRMDTVGFAYPATWRKTGSKDERGRPVVEFSGPALPSGVTDGHLEISGIEGYQGDFGAQLAQFRGLARLNRYRLTANRPMKMDGARRAHRFEATYELDDGSGHRVPFKLLGMYVLTEEQVLVEFMLRSPQEGTSSAQLPEIFKSFRVRG